METFALKISLIALGLLLASCSRTIESNETRLKINTPQSNPQSKVSSTSLTSLPSNRKACFAARVSASDIPLASPLTCDPNPTLTAGFVEAGGTLELSVPKGEGRHVEIFVYLQAVGENSACPTINTYLPQGQLDKVYRIGESFNVSLTEAESSVSIEAKYPGDALNIVKQMNLPESCLPVITNPTHNKRFALNAITQTATGSGVRLHGRVETTQTSTVLSGSGIKFKARGQ